MNSIKQKCYLILKNKPNSAHVNVIFGSSNQNKVLDMLRTKSLEYLHHDSTVQKKRGTIFWSSMDKRYEFSYNPWDVIIAPYTLKSTEV